MSGISEKVRKQNLEISRNFNMLKDRMLKNKYATKKFMELNFKKFTAMIDECNEWAVSYSEHKKSNHRIHFYVIPKSVETFMWKLTAKIEFRKVNLINSEILKTRTLKLKQFIIIYQQISIIKHSRGFAQSESLNYSVILNRMDINQNSRSVSLSIDGLSPTTNECSICLLSTSNVVLPCMHAYCETCALKWCQSESVIRPELNPWEVVQLNRSNSLPSVSNDNSESTVSTTSQYLDDDGNSFVESYSHASRFTCPMCREECSSQSDIWNILDHPENMNDVETEMNDVMNSMIEQYGKKKD